MTKQAGMGDNFYFQGLDVSGDINSLNRIACPLTTQDVTAINQSGNARIGLIHDGGIDFVAYWNPGAEADAAHNALSALPTTDVHLQYCRGTTLGNHAASVIAKQVDYAATRGTDGSLTFSVATLASAGTGLEWGQLLTAGKLTQGAAGNGTSIDLGASPTSYSFGWSVYLQVFAFMGTSITVKIQDSANNTDWLDLAGATFTAVTAAPATQRISDGATSTDTVRRYIRLVSTGTFSNAIFSVNFVRHEAAGHA